MGERMLRYDVESSPQIYARVGGALYLMLIGLVVLACCRDTH